MDRETAEKDAQYANAAQAAIPDVVPGKGIGWAVKQLQHGFRVRRRGWNGLRQYLELQLPDRDSKMTLPYVYITTVQGYRVPWLCSQTDLLSFDWEVASAP